MNRSPPGNHVTKWAEKLGRRPFSFLGGPMGMQPLLATKAGLLGEQKPSLGQRSGSFTMGPGLHWCYITASLRSLPREEGSKYEIAGKRLCFWRLTGWIQIKRKSKFSVFLTGHLFSGSISISSFFPQPPDFRAVFLNMLGRRARCFFFFF